MTVKPRHTPLRPIDAWGRRPVYHARIIKQESAGIVVLSSGVLAVGKRISFAKVSDLSRNEARPARSKWRSGVIWRIEPGCLHLTRT